MVADHSCLSRNDEFTFVELVAKSRGRTVHASCLTPPRNAYAPGHHHGPQAEAGRVQEGAEDFRFDPRYPDMETDRNNNFVLIEILSSVGRSVKVKRKVLADIISGIARHGIDGEYTMVVFKETAWENWSFSGGRILHA